MAWRSLRKIGSHFGWRRGRAEGGVHRDGIGVVIGCLGGRGGEPELRIGGHRVLFDQCGSLGAIVVQLGSRHVARDGRPRQRPLRRDQGRVGRYTRLLRVLRRISLCDREGKGQGHGRERSGGPGSCCWCDGRQCVAKAPLCSLRAGRVLGEVSVPYIAEWSLRLSLWDDRRFRRFAF